MRNCKICGQLKDESLFSSPLKDWSKKKQEWKYYLRPRCKECELVYNRERYQRLKNDPEFKRKACAFAKKEREKQHRKDYMKHYLEENKHHITILSNRRFKKYADKISRNLSDAYVLRIIKKYKSSPDVINNTMLDKARLSIISNRIKRLINQLDNI